MFCHSIAIFADVHALIPHLHVFAERKQTHRWECVNFLACKHGRHCGSNLTLITTSEFFTQLLHLFVVLQPLLPACDSSWNHNLQFPPFVYTQVQTIRPSILCALVCYMCHDTDRRWKEDYMFFQMFSLDVYFLTCGCMTSVCFYCPAGCNVTRGKKKMSAEEINTTFTQDPDTS